MVSHQNPDYRANAFNEALDSGNEGAILAQLKGIQYDHMMATGYEPKLTGGRAPTQDIRGFESEAQVIAAMQDPGMATTRHTSKRLNSDCCQQCV